MGDRGFFSGTSCHIEYHTVDPKKEKAADCVFLDTNRICNCKRSPRYQEKCFEATICTYRVWSAKGKSNKKSISSDGHYENNNRPVAKVKKPSNIPIKCDIVPGTILIHKDYGPGRYCGYNGNTGVMLIQFRDRQAWFEYPGSIVKGLIKVTSEQMQNRNLRTKSEPPPKAEPQRKSMKITVSGNNEGRYLLRLASKREVQEIAKEIGEKPENMFLWVCSETKRKSLQVKVLNHTMYMGMDLFRAAQKEIENAVRFFLKYSAR